MTDFRAVWDGTIMGPAGLTAVFGMGTGVAPPVWSPGRRPAGLCNPPGAVWPGRRASDSVARRVAAASSLTVAPDRCDRGIVTRLGVPRRPGAVGWIGVGSGWSSRSAVRTGRLRSSRTVHARPIDLVVSQEPSLALET